VATTARTYSALQRAVVYSLYCEKELAIVRRSSRYAGSVTKAPHSDAYGLGATAAASIIDFFNFSLLAKRWERTPRSFRSVRLYLPAIRQTARARPIIALSHHPSCRRRAVPGGNIAKPLIVLLALSSLRR
jgi:hypothetical protein